MIAQELALLLSEPQSDDPGIRVRSLTLAVTHAGGRYAVSPASGWYHLLNFSIGTSLLVFEE